MIFIQPNFRSKSAKIIALIFICGLLQMPFVFAQKGVTNNGARILVNTGAVINITGAATDANFTNKTLSTYHGRIDLDGKIKLQGSWTNNAISGNVLINVDSDGEVIFNGTTTQSISGSYISSFEKLTLNNINGLSLSRHINVYGALTLTSGNIVLNAYNLSIQSTGSTAGTFDASKMVVTNSTGTLRKYFTTTGVFTFPIGDNTGTLEFSPIAFTLNSAAGYSSAYVSAKVTDDKHPNNGSIAEYLTRYWTMSSSGLTSPNYNATFNYLNEDIYGTETNIYSARYSGATRYLDSKVNDGSNLVTVSNMSSFYSYTGVDGTSPTVEITSTAPNPTNLNPILVTITFSEQVTGFTRSDIDSTNCTLSALSTSDNRIYTLNVYPTGSAVSLNIASAKCTDLAGNGNAAATQFSRTYDGAAPSVILGSSVPARTNASFSVTITFIEEINNFAKSDITFVNVNTGSTALTTSDSIVFTLNVTPNANGLVTINVPSGCANDNAGNGNTVSNTISTIFDDVEPNPTLSSTATNPTSLKPFVVKIAFDEKINGSTFSLTDITVGNGTKADLSPVETDSIWNVNITPSAEGIVTVDLAAGLVSDYAGNTSNAATQFSISYDGTKPDVTISSTETNPTNNTPFEITIEFSEVVSGFAVGDILVGNGTADNLTVVTPNQEWTADITPAVNGLVTVNIAGGVATDGAGNGNNAATQYSITYDAAHPTVSTYTPADGATGVSLTANLELVFNEVVNVENDGFIYIKETIGDAIFQTIDLSSTSVVSGTGTTTITINPVSDFITLTGYYVIIVDTAFTDNAGNYFAGISSKDTWNFTSVDATLPSIVSVTPVDNSVDVDTSASFVITLTEIVDAVAAKYITIMNATTSSVHETIEATNAKVTGSGTSVVTINPTASLSGENNYYIQVDAGAFEDADNNPFAGISSSTEWSFTTEDVTPPTVNTYNPVDNSADVVVGSNLQLTFSENVAKGASGGSITIKRASDNSTYETIVDVTTGPVTVSNNVVTINPSTDFESETEYYVLIDAGAFVDVSSNDNPFAGIAGIGDWSFTTEDNIVPTVTVTSSEPNPTNNAFSVTITFSEEVQNFTIDDISAENANLSGFATGDNTTFTVAVNPGGNGIVSVEVITSVCQDLSGNINAASNVFEITYDNSQPSVILSTLEGDPTNSALFDIEIEFSEEINGFALGEISVGNGVASNLLTSDSITFTAQIAPSSDNIVTIDVNATVVADDAGNNNTASNQISLTYDGTDPTLAISTSDPNPTNNTSLNVIFTFSEQVSGFVIGDISVTNGSAASCVTADSIVFDLEITATPNTSVTIGCIAGVAKDLAGNDNVAPTSLIVVHDNISPTVSITSSASPGPVVVSPFEVTITFIEEVTSFDLSDVTVTNGYATDLQTADDITFTANIFPGVVGAVNVDINAGAAYDLANNPNTAATQFTIQYEGVNTTVDLSYTGANPTNSTPLPITITFNESVNGFETNDFVVTNGSVINLQTTDYVLFTASLVPTATGLVTARVPANKVTNSMGNGNSPSDTIQVTFDNTLPSVTIASTQTSPTNSNAIPITIIFSETVTGFFDTDVTVGNGSLSGWSVAGNVYSTTLVPDAPGTVTVNVAAGKANDLVGNANTASNTFSIVYDTSLPTVTITSSQSGTIFDTMFDITITFNEEVTGFTLGEITVSNGTASNLVTTDNIVYTADITATDVGIVTVDVAAGVAIDLAGNLNTASSQFSIIYGGPKPDVIISSVILDPTNVSPITLDINFTESVTGLELTDFVVTGGTLDGLLGSGADYTVQLTPGADGIVTVSLPADSVVNTYSNGNTASNTFEITYDGTAPTVTITSSAGNYTNVSPIPVTITFSESVTKFALANVDIVNGTSTVLSANTDSTIFTLNITPSDTGNVTVDVAAGETKDLAGNNNTIATQLFINYDNVAPTVIISSTVPSPTTSQAIPVTVTFSEVVNGFEVNDLTIVNGSAQNLIQNGKVFTFTLVPANDGYITVDIATGVAQDIAGNSNIVATQFSILAENGPPSVTISYTGSNPTNSTSIPVDIVFSEPVTGFESTDVVITNATIFGSMTIVDNTYSIVLNPVVDGIITINVAANVANDLFGNPNTAATPDTILFDGTAPTVAIETMVTSPTNNSSIPLNIIFSEKITGFDITDFTVVNGSIINLSGSDSLYYATLEPTDGIVTVSIAANAIIDLAGNGNIVSNEISLTFDGTAPTVLITSTSTDPTNNDAIPLTFAFSESVTGFVVEDIIVVNGSLIEFANSGNDYTAKLVPAADGIITVNIAADVATDVVGNGNLAATQYEITYDGSAPVATIGSTQTSPTNSIAIPVTISFTEAVIGFELADITVTNGTLSTFTNTENVYSVILTPTNTGAVTINIAENSVTDEAGNGNPATTEFSIVYDGTAPGVAITSSAGSIITSPNFTVTITFTEAVTGFANTDVVITNGNLTGLTTTDNIVFTASVTATSQGAVTINVPAGVATDLSGNDNTAATEFSITYNPSTGIDDVKQYQVAIYSIPGAIVIEINNPENIRFEAGQVEVYNVIGLPVVNIPFDNFNKISIPVKDASGIYVVKLTIDENIHMKKVFINK